jgi:competence protein ComEC
MNKGIQVRRLGSSLTTTVGKTQWSFLHPPPLPLTGRDYSNNNSLVAKAHLEEWSFLFTGDIQQRPQRLLLEEPAALKANVLKSPHHGGSDDLNIDFIRTVNPRFCIICESAQPDTMSSFDESVTAMRAIGITSFATGRHGAIALNIMPDRIVVFTGSRMQKRAVYFRRSTAE